MYNNHHITLHINISYQLNPYNIPYKPPYPKILYNMHKNKHSKIISIYTNCTNLFKMQKKYLQCKKCYGILYSTEDTKTRCKSVK